MHGILYSQSTFISSCHSTLCNRYPLEFETLHFFPSSPVLKPTVAPANDGQSDDTVASQPCLIYALFEDEPSLVGGEVFRNRSKNK